jgi:hypothetical protein
MEIEAGVGAVHPHRGRRQFDHTHARGLCGCIRAARKRALEQPRSRLRQALVAGAGAGERGRPAHLRPRQFDLRADQRAQRRRRRRGGFQPGCRPHLDDRPAAMAAARQSDGGGDDERKQGQRKQAQVAPTSATAVRGRRQAAGEPARQGAQALARPGHRCGQPAHVGRSGCARIAGIGHGSGSPQRGCGQSSRCPPRPPARRRDATARGSAGSPSAAA